MRALVQRVLQAEVSVGDRMAGRCRKGLLVYVGISPGDSPEAAEWLGEKIANLRIFEDEQGKMNLSAEDVRGGILAVPSFTLLGDARKGRRPAFTDAAGPEIAAPLFEKFVEAVRRQGVPIACGLFGADMVIRSDADGPVNLCIDSPM
ncbi:MAG TPA: D-tyrosyl-tRNA(Tyr) deacylase [Phycisphaerales bacterium]|nr:D-tyrosyl-tRNA(Tyr) deacylase [Phycisphaerales bacterium]